MHYINHLLKKMVMLMMTNQELIETIRTNCAERLLRTISLKKMQRKLNELFVDWQVQSNIESDDGIQKTIKYNKCESLNDERTIKFNQRFKQATDVFDETRQIWIDKYIDPINDE